MFMTHLHLWVGANNVAGRLLSIIEGNIFPLTEAGLVVGSIIYPYGVDGSTHSRVMLRKLYRW